VEHVVVCQEPAIFIKLILPNQDKVVKLGKMNSIDGYWKEVVCLVQRKTFHFSIQCDHSNTARKDSGQLVVVPVPRLCFLISKSNSGSSNVGKLGKRCSDEQNPDRSNVCFDGRSEIGPR